MEPQQAPPVNQVQSPLGPPVPQKKGPGKRLAIIAGVIVGLLLLPFVVFSIIGMVTGGGGSAKSEQFFEVLSAASQKTKVQQLTDYKFWKQGVETTAEPSRYELSLSEYDVKSQEFNTVNASANLGTDAERCIKGAGYTYRIDAARDSKGMAGAVSAVNDPAAERREVKADNLYGPCNLERSFHTGKFSDGIIPVGVTQEQATSWINYLKNKEVFTVKDEGAAQYKGKEVRKFSFAITEKRDTSNLFYAVRDGDTGKPEGSGINWKVVFGQQITQNLATPTGLTGFYLVDQATKLPVYSEFNSKPTAGKNASQLESFAVKTQYSYPDQLSITETTKLSEL